jgi:predicted MFS family arabinose efflux permease
VSAEAPRGFVRPSRAVLLLAVLCLLIMLAEGAMADWSAVYLRGDLNTSAGFAALGFAAFALGMTTARLLGDAVNHRIGAVRLLRAGVALAAVALGAALALADPVLALAGFALVGVGVANGVPILFSAAGHTEGEETGPAIAAVSSMGSIGFLAGPPLIGFAADATSLAAALAAVCVALAAVAVFASRACARADAPAAATAGMAAAR